MEPDAIRLAGTSHLSPDSAAGVARVVRALKPEIVAVELCRSREVLTADCSVCSMSKLNEGYCPMDDDPSLGFWSIG